MVRPFRFIATMPRLDRPADQWRDAVRRIEDLGFTTVAISDHFTGGWMVEPTVALMAAADATEHLRVLSLVLSNDYRHPVLAHKALATIEALSGGRLEIGLGAGWMVSDYQAADIPYLPASVRIARLEESVRILKGLFGPEPFSFAGRYYRVDSLDGLPKPLQRPRPPLLLGGGGRRMLALAAREADLVGVNPNLREGRLAQGAGRDLSAARFAEKVRWVREQAAASGRSVDEVELQIDPFVCEITSSRGDALAAVASFAARLGVDPALLDDSPAVLAGSVEQCVDALEERRERYGFSYVSLGSDVEAAAPVVAKLAGT